MHCYLRNVHNRAWYGVLDRQCGVGKREGGWASEWVGEGISLFGDYAMVTRARVPPHQHQHDVVEFMTTRMQQGCISHMIVSCSAHLLCRPSTLRFDTLATFCNMSTALGPRLLSGEWAQTWLGVQGCHLLTLPVILSACTAICAMCTKMHGMVCGVGKREGGWAREWVGEGISLSGDYVMLTRARVPPHQHQRDVV